MVEVNHSDELFEGFNTGWSRVFCDSRDFGREWSDAVFVNPVSQEIDFGHSKLAFLDFYHESVFLEAVEESDEVVMVFC